MNKKPELIEFQSEHFDLLVLRTHERIAIGAEYLLATCQISVCKTIIYDGRVIGILGYYEIHVGCLQVFVIPSKYISTCAKSFIKIVRAELAKLLQRPCVRRLQTSSLSDRGTDDWMIALGFRWEGTMLSYSPLGDDYKMWAVLSDGTIPKLGLVK